MARPRQVQYETIAAAYASGESQESIAERFGLTRRTVLRAVATCIPRQERDGLAKARLTKNGAIKSHSRQSRKIASGEVIISEGPDHATLHIDGINFKVDKGDRHLLAKYSWRVSSQGRLTRQARVGGRNVNIYIYHDVLGVAPNRMHVIDHANGDVTDNRRCNLRLATASQNSVNRGPSSRNKTGFKGVSMENARFSARIKANGKVVHLGSFATATSAAQAYDHAAQSIYGEFAWLNSVHGQLSTRAKG